MLYRTLGKTGFSVSAVGIETHQWSGRGGLYLREEEAREILARARDLGVNFIDTGECYLYHAAERLIGNAIGADRDKFIIAAKFGHTIREGGVAEGWERSVVEKELETSLKALRTDYIDLYQIHVNLPGDGKSIFARSAQIREALDAALKTGKIRAAGICLGDNSLLDEDGEILRRALREFPLSAVQAVYNRLDRGAEKSILPAAAKENLGVIARVPLAKGYLSGRFKPSDAHLKNAFDEEDDRRRRAAAAEIMTREVPPGADLAEWAIGWCASREGVATVVPGCTAAAQLDSTARALEYIHL